MGKIIHWHHESAYIAPLSPACEMCAAGSKLVLLITGLCSTNCFYCPLSFKKGGTDCIYVNEWKLKNENDIEKLIHEADYIDATGAGITGGDPLIVWKRTRRYISFLKDNFGPDFHIHMYTSGLQNAENIPDLVAAGLDEIRFHPKLYYWDNMDKNFIKHTIENTLETNADVAIEIPAIPGMEQRMISLIRWSDAMGIKWINLNELEYAERNASILNNSNFIVKNDISAAVKGSQEVAYLILRMITHENLQIGVHYCSSSFKDGVQLTNRIKRRARNIARGYQIITDEGTLLIGVVKSSNIPLHELYNYLKQRYNILDKYIFLNIEKDRIELGIWILEKLASELTKQNITCYMVEEYPTADRLEVERIPLPI